MINLQLILQIISLLCLINPLLLAAQSMAKPNCPHVCGNVTLRYPFGMGHGCYHNDWFAITCDKSSNKPLLTKFNLEVARIYLENNLVELEIPISVANSNCPSSQGEGAAASTKVWTSTNFRQSPFKFSQDYNMFTVVGCDGAQLQPSIGETRAMTGCTSSCNSTKDNLYRDFNGVHVHSCQTTLQNDYLDGYKITMSGNTTTNCTYAFLLGNYGIFSNGFLEMLSTPSVIYSIEHVPVIVQWTITDLGDVRAGHFFPDYYCSNTIRWPNPGKSYSCQCKPNHYGNPYILNGCKVVEACANCLKQCAQRPGGRHYFHRHRSNRTKIILGSSLGGGLLLLVLCGCLSWLYKLIRKRRIMLLKKKFFKKNGGLLLQQQISSDEGRVEKTIVFTSKELEKATDNFNENRILGQGGQGTVYKGMLIDGKIVAIKKSKVIDENQLEQFINEVVILSQINHRNIVKLLGCCLETEVPLLVYEFISNGNLFELIRDQNEEFPLSWKMRLQIATEVAGALAYLHSASSTPIYHRDIKSTNILLDEKYRAKISDFGTSRTISIEQTHLTTLVHGTFGYLDPEYFQSSQFTDKSDVYSFGVVLVELLTGQKPISSINSKEERSLATRFIQYLEESRLFDLVDAHVIEEAAKEEVIAVADILRRCLSLNGKKRPTMKEVVMELEGIRMSQMPSTAPKKFNEDEYIIEMKESPDDALTSTQSSRNYHRVFSDVDPLLLKTV